MSQSLFQDITTWNAYAAIHDFFDAFGLEHALKYIDSILQAAARPKVWEKEVPANLIFYIGKLKAVCTVAYIINYNDIQGNEAIIPGPEDAIPDITVISDFMDTWYSSSAWNNFPRHLTARQYHNPYLGIKKFCTYMAEQEWNNFLDEIVNCALSNNQINETYPSNNILKIYLRIAQLIEACRLIDVRTNRKEIKPATGKKKKKHHK